MAHHYIAPKRGIASTVAEVDGQLVGFQALEWADPDWPAPDAHPSDWAVIASFVSPAAQGRGVGRALFAATRAAARAVGVAVIDATIRADNKAGLGYYTGLGFVDYAVTEALPLSDGTCIARIRKRYDLG
jgi:ribosomal protein S18 acetylase RimI-like enzyme